eukprot:Skav226942  [mRNA]  locus=scaffold965:324064:333925:- [translate_table: standard]
METCLAPLRCWLHASHRAEDAVSRVLARLAKGSARNPWKCLCLSFLGCVVFGLGFVFRFESVSDANELWVDQHSQQTPELSWSRMKNTEWMWNYFTGAGRPNRLIITVPCSALTFSTAEEKMIEILQIADDVRALVDESGNKFSDLCIWTGTDCFNSGAGRYFGSTADFNSTVQNDSDILEAVNKATYPNGQDSWLHDNMGGIERDASGNVVSATAVRVDWILAAAWDACLVAIQSWDATGAIMLISHVAQVNVYVAAERSRDDELNRTVQAETWPQKLHIVAFVLMSTFCACFLGKAASWTQSRRLLGAKGGFGGSHVANPFWL